MRGLWATLEQFASLPLRIGLAILFIYTGVAKAANISGTAQFFSSLGYPIPTFFAILMIAEIVGGAMLLLGLLTRYAAAWLSIILIVAILSFNLRAGGQPAGFFPIDMLKNIGLLSGCLSLVFNGAGRFSLDRLLLIE